MSLKVSSKYVINIHEYMMNFLDIQSYHNNKITHKDMNIFLKENNLKIPHRIKFSEAKEEDILRGNCLIVKDDINQKAIYVNQRNIENIIDDLSQYQISHKKNDTIDEKLSISKNKVKKLSK